MAQSMVQLDLPSLEDFVSLYIKASCGGIFIAVWFQPTVENKIKWALAEKE